MLFEDGVTSGRGLPSIGFQISTHCKTMLNSIAIKTCLALAFAAALAIPGIAAAAPKELPIVAAPPGTAIDFYPVSTTRQKGSRFINTKALPRLGYAAAAPALQVERLRSVIEEVRLTPVEGQLAIELRGDLAEILKIGAASTQGSEIAKKNALQIKVVAGACNRVRYNSGRGSSCRVPSGGEIEDRHQLAA